MISSRKTDVNLVVKSHILNSIAERARYQNDPDYRARKIAHVKAKYQNDPEYRTKHLSYQKDRKLKNRLEFKEKEAKRNE